MQPVAVTSTPGGCPVAAGKRAGRQTAQAAGAGSKFCHTLPASLRAPLSRAERPGGRNSRLVVANTASLEAQAQQAPPGTPAPKTKYAASAEVVMAAPGVDILRVACTARLPEVEFNLRRGTTTNSYLLKGAGGVYEALIDVPSRVFDVDFAAQLSACGATDTLRHVIITRLTPERLPVLAAVLRTCRQRGIQLSLTNPALQLLNDRAAADETLAQALKGVQIEVVGRGSELRLSAKGQGKGRSLRFIPIPTPRWPDLTAVYSEEDKLLFSSNLFSAHAAPPGTAGGTRNAPRADWGWSEYGEDWKYYFDCMLAPAARQTAAALDKLNINASQARAGGTVSKMLAPLRRLADLVTELTMGADDGVAEPLAVAAIAPMHGPIVRQSLTELVGRYGDWTTAQLKAAASGSVAVLYASAYGNTASLAQAISHGITKAGVAVDTLNLEAAGLDELERALDRCSGFLLGSPTLGGHMPTQVQTALGTIIRNANARQVPCSVFGSFGWSGEAVDMMEKRLKDAGFRFAFDPVRCKFKPTPATLQLCEESGLDLAQEIKRAQKRKERMAAEKLSVAETGSGRALALGRVLGSLCVLTAKDGDAQGAMLASWVSQASFDPPGLTVAVKRDRAVESMLPVGAQFVLNVLAEGKDRPIMKQLLKPFKPAEDRFAGMQVQEAESSGAVVLPDAAAYIECTVSQRMEAGDHYIVYATVDTGKVLDNDAQSVVHYRKIGTSY
ncbi:flavin oxidoreductase [Micractinium conductrix]|uniref:Flavin oxidoreductase n=1 Tax=Micractinium conductrix TaxID=554055 RepID=A0A2P6VQK1_9CHLO|nr:flavin oxidoreductase [Micractinium conductrix]|eukprot:PSC76351.1 flavin oxidoreductase [Micractinium conductrix]